MRQAYSTERENLIDKTTTAIVEKSKRMQSSFFRKILRYLADNLEIKDGQIRSTSNNYRIIADINKVKERFDKTDSAPFLKWMARRYIDILKSSSRYFSHQTSVTDVGRVKSRVEKNLLRQRGITVTGANKIKIESGGFLESITDFSEAMRVVKEIATQRAADGEPISRLNRAIRDYSNSSSATLPAHHLQQAAIDSYSMFDRGVANDYAKNLGLRAFIYQGGLIDSSRDFCEERNNKVFTIEEAEEWKGLNWDGKWPDGDSYVPLRHMGGARCRHQPDYITDRLAIRLRPELKELWNL